MRKLISSIIGAALLCLPLFTLNARAENWPDGKLHAFTMTSPAGGPTVSNFSCVDLGDGNLLLAFVIQGHGVWTLSTITRANQETPVAGGVASENPKGKITYCIVPAADYCTCVFHLGNAHGWFGPELVR